MQRNPEMDALAKRLAELKPNWALPGMACLDGEDLWRQISYRYDHATIWSLTYRDGETKLFDDFTNLAEGYPRPFGLVRAIANGPDYTDLATVGALLMVYLPTMTLDGYDQGSRWAWWIDTHEDDEFSIEICKTREEAILRALIALLGKTNG